MIPLPPAPVFPDTSYQSSFLPQALIAEFTPSKELHGRNIPHAHKTSLISSPAPVVNTVPNLQSDSYHARWRALLGLELSHVAAEKSNTILWETGLKVWDFKDAEFIVNVPGIRENYPKLDPGDLIHMREVFQDHHSFSSNAFEGRITVLRKREGIVRKSTVLGVKPSLFDISVDFTATDLKRHLESPPSHEKTWAKEADVPMLFNYSFLTNPRPFCDMDLAAQALSNDLTAEGSHHARRWLFPTPADLGASYLLSNDHSEHIDEEAWVDMGLNDEQQVCRLFTALPRNY